MEGGSKQGEKVESGGKMPDPAQEEITKGRVWPQSSAVSVSETGCVRYLRAV